MSQTDMNAANASGAVYRADMNAHLEALVTNNSGIVAPPVTFPNMWWYDSSLGILKQRNNANTLWLSLWKRSLAGWQVLLTKGIDVASATNLIVGSDGNYFDVTGTTTITSIGTVGVGTSIKLHFDSVLVLDHHSTDLVLPGAANITTQVGDEAEFIEYSISDWRCVNYLRADGGSIAIPPIDVVNSQWELIESRSFTDATDVMFNLVGFNSYQVVLRKHHFRNADTGYRLLLTRTTNGLLRLDGYRYHTNRSTILTPSYQAFVSGNDSKWVVVADSDTDSVISGSMILYNANSTTLLTSIISNLVQTNNVGVSGAMSILHGYQDSIEAHNKITFTSIEPSRTQGGLITLYGSSP